RRLPVHSYLRLFRQQPLREVDPFAQLRDFATHLLNLLSEILAQTVELVPDPRVRPAANPLGKRPNHRVQEHESTDDCDGRENGHRSASKHEHDAYEPNEIVRIHQATSPRRPSATRRRGRPGGRARAQRSPTVPARPQAGAAALRSRRGAQTLPRGHGPPRLRPISLPSPCAPDYPSSQSIARSP